MSKNVIIGKMPVVPQKGLGPNSAGQSGDTQGLSNLPEADSESVEELVEEGQYFEADIVSGIENADKDEFVEIVTREDKKDTKGRPVGRPKPLK